MEGIRYVVGDATRPAGEGPRVIAHICNDSGGWGRGFVTAVSGRWPEPERRYRDWFAGREAIPFDLGQVQLVAVEEQLWVANMIGQHGTRREDQPAPIRYDAVRACLQRVAAFAVEHDASVHMPRIGTGLAGGSWEEISGIIEAELVARGIAVTVYDLG